MHYVKIDDLCSFEMSIRILNKIILLELVNIGHKTISFILFDIVWYKLRRCNHLNNSLFFILTSVEPKPCSFLSVTESLKSETSTKFGLSTFWKNCLSYPISCFKLNLSIRKIMQSDLNISTEI